MLIGIDASRAFLKRRTGIEEYSYQTIRHLCDSIPSSENVVLYLRSDQEVSFPLPKNWSIRKLSAYRFWTQGRLSLELLFRPVDVLFVPAHTVPFIHPKRTIVTVHGLEYERFPRAYGLFERWYMRISIRFSCWWASQIVAVSENTKRDLVALYRVSPEKISVVYEGFDESPHVEKNREHLSEPVVPNILFIGRLEERKNIIGIIDAFELLKERYHIPHTLILAGRPGYGYERIKSRKSKLKNPESVIELGYVSDTEKQRLLRGADVFLFPTLYEGFGLPVLEAQIAGVPVVTSDRSSLPEVGGDGALYCNPEDPESIAEAAWKIISDPILRDVILIRGEANARRFSWRACADSVARLLC